MVAPAVPGRVAALIDVADVSAHLATIRAIGAVRGVNSALGSSLPPGMGGGLGRIGRTHAARLGCARRNKTAFPLSPAGGERPYPASGPRVRRAQTIRSPHPRAPESKRYLKTEWVAQHTVTFFLPACLSRLFRVLAEGWKNWFLAGRRDQETGEKPFYYGEHNLSEPRAFQVVLVPVPVPPPIPVASWLPSAIHTADCPNCANGR